MIRKTFLAYLIIALGLFGYMTFSPPYSAGPTIARAVVAFAWPLMAIEVAKGVADMRRAQP